MFKEIAWNRTEDLIDFGLDGVCLSDIKHDVKFHLSSHLNLLLTMVFYKCLIHCEHCLKLNKHQKGKTINELESERFIISG